MGLAHRARVKMKKHSSKKPTCKPGKTRSRLTKSRRGAYHTYKGRSRPASDDSGSDMDFDMGPISRNIAEASPIPRIPNIPLSYSTVLIWAGIVGAVVVAMVALIFALRKTREVQRRNEEKILGRPTITSSSTRLNKDFPNEWDPRSNSPFITTPKMSDDPWINRQPHEGDSGASTSEPLASVSVREPTPPAVPMYPVGGKQRRPSLS